MNKRGGRGAATSQLVKPPQIPPPVHHTDDLNFINRSRGFVRQNPVENGIRSFDQHAKRRGNIGPGNAEARLMAKQVGDCLNAVKIPLGCRWLFEPDQFVNV